MLAWKCGQADNYKEVCLPLLLYFFNIIQMVCYVGKASSLAVRLSYSDLAHQLTHFKKRVKGHRKSHELQGEKKGLAAAQ